MNQTTLHDLIPVLQVAIGPVILISGVGLLLLTMTNRLARIIDRSRLLAAREPETEGSDRALVENQIAILRRRARLVRTAIFLASVCVLAVSLLIILLFLAALLRLEIVPLLIVVFIVAAISLIASLVAFLRDVNLSLVALDLELAAAREAHRRP